MTTHRRIAIPPYRPRGTCRLCDKQILNPDGTPNTRRNWHPECVHAFRMANHPDYARRVIYARDRGVCAACGADTHRTAVERGGTVRLRPWHGPEVGGDYCRVDIYETAEWHLDHIVPLIDGGAHDESNMQTLCVDCHKAKTAREATERARRRRGPDLLTLLEAAE
jgi:hypothetical protein